MQNNLNEIGRQIKARRTYLGLYQKDVAKSANVSIPTLIAIEQGESSTTENLFTVMDVLKINFNLTTF